PAAPKPDAARSSPPRCPGRDFPPAPPSHPPPPAPFPPTATASRSSFAPFVPFVGCLEEEEQLGKTKKNLSPGPSPRRGGAGGEVLLYLYSNVRLPGPAADPA